MARAGPSIPSFDNPDYTEWALAARDKAIAPSNTEFDSLVWSYDNIAATLATPEGIHKFTCYKLSTTHTQTRLPDAIRLKFVHRDTRFFTTFTRNTSTKPAHQKEYESLLGDATNAYKANNEITIINRQTAVQLRQC